MEETEKKKVLIRRSQVKSKERSCGNELLKYTKVLVGNRNQVCSDECDKGQR